MAKKINPWRSNPLDPIGKCSFFFGWWFCRSDLSMVYAMTWWWPQMILFVVFFRPEMVVGWPFVSCVKVLEVKLPKPCRNTNNVIWCRCNVHSTFFWRQSSSHFRGGSIGLWEITLLRMTNISPCPRNIFITSKVQRGSNSSTLGWTGHGRGAGNSWWFFHGFFGLKFPEGKQIT